MQRWGSIKNRGYLLYGWLFSFTGGLMYSAIAAAEKTPGFPEADTGGLAALGKGNWIEVIKHYVKQGGTVIGLALSVLAFVWVGYAALTKFNEAREGRAEWAELGVLAAAGAVILIFIAILLSQVGTAITTGTTK